MNAAADKTVGILTIMFICHSCLNSKTNSLYNGLMKYLIIIIFIINIIIIILMQARPIPAPCFLRRASAAARLLGLRVRIPLTRHCGLSFVSVAYCQVQVSETV
jgi:hypothetical protein